MVFASGETKIGMVVRHGKVKKLRAMIVFFPFLRRNLTNFREFSATWTLTDTHEKTNKKIPFATFFILP